MTQMQARRHHAIADVDTWGGLEHTFAVNRDVRPSNEGSLIRAQINDPQFPPAYQGGQAGFAVEF
jgi:hypothetical protein